MIMKLSLPLNEKDAMVLTEKHLSDKSVDELMVIAMISPEATDFARFLESAKEFCTVQFHCTEKEADERVNKALSTLNTMLIEAEEMRKKKHDDTKAKR